MCHNKVANTACSAEARSISVLTSRPVGGVHEHARGHSPSPVTRPGRALRSAPEPASCEPTRPHPRCDPARTHGSGAASGPQRSRRRLTHHEDSLHDFLHQIRGPLGGGGGDPIRLGRARSRRVHASGSRRPRAASPPTRHVPASACARASTRLPVGVSGRPRRDGPTRLLVPPRPRRPRRCAASPGRKRPGRARPRSPRRGRKAPRPGQAPRAPRGTEIDGGCPRPLPPPPPFLGLYLLRRYARTWAALRVQRHLRVGYKSGTCVRAGLCAPVEVVCAPVNTVYAWWSGRACAPRSLPVRRADHLEAVTFFPVTSKLRARRLAHGANRGRRGRVELFEKCSSVGRFRGRADRRRIAGGDDLAQPLSRDVDPARPVGHRSARAHP